MKPVRSFRVGCFHRRLIGWSVLFGFLSSFLRFNQWAQSSFSYLLFVFQYLRLNGHYLRIPNIILIRLDLNQVQHFRIDLLYPYLVSVQRKRIFLSCSPVWIQYLLCVGYCRPSWMFNGNLYNQQLLHLFPLNSDWLAKL